MQQWKLIFSLIVLFIAAIWLAIWVTPKSGIIKVVACDIGQGDAYLIQQGATQIVVDGGPGNKVIDCLDSHVPFWDRKIEAVILTHPQADHYHGLIEVFRRYKVDYFLANELDSSADSYQVLKKEVGVRGTKVLNPIPAKDLRVGLMLLDVLYPLPISDIDPDNVLGAASSEEDPNNFSIVFELKYMDFEMLFTGDIGPQVIDEVIGAGIDDVDVLKVPHHGSKNGLTEDLLKALQPEYAIISAGVENRFGHPHAEVINLLEQTKVHTYRTDKTGEVVFYSDGTEIWVEE